MLNDEIIELIKKTGIRNVGFCAFSEVADRLLPCRAASRIPKNAKTVICMVFPYRVQDKKPNKLSRYAAVPDYHMICGEYLSRAVSFLREEFPLNKFEPFIDNSPIPEVYAAACAGLGVYGENRLLITEEYGSWVFIGEIVTDLMIPAHKNLKKCLVCGDCKKACQWGLHGRSCLSALSQQKKELTENEKSSLIDNNILWGCDICADVCPMNQNTNPTYIKEFIEGYRQSYILGEDITDRAFEWRGEKVIKRNAEWHNN